MKNIFLAYVGNEDSVPVRIIVGSTVGSLLVIAFGIIMIVLLFKRSVKTSVINVYIIW